MALRIDEPKYHKLFLDKSDKLYKNTGERTYIVIREARQREFEERDKRFSEFINRTSPEADITHMIVYKFSIETLRRIDAWLLMVDCNIESKDGMLFKLFGDMSAMGETDFKYAWDSLPYEVVNEIHSLIVSVVPEFAIRE